MQDWPVGEREENARQVINRRDEERIDCLELIDVVDPRGRDQADACGPGILAARNLCDLKTPDPPLEATALLGLWCAQTLDRDRCNPAKPCEHNQWCDQE